jgi:hypothetical protein
LKKYPNLDAESAKFTAFYTGRGRMLLIYNDDGVGQENLHDCRRIRSDISKLLRYALNEKLPEQEILKVFKEYFQDLFVQSNFVSSAPMPKANEVLVPLQAKPEKVEEKIEEKQEKPKIEKTEETKKEEFLPLEEIRKMQYEEVKKIAEEFNPPINDFFARAAKIEYEKVLIGIRDNKKRVEADYVLCWFIKCYEKASDKQKLLNKFYEEIRKIG